MAALFVYGTLRSGFQNDPARLLRDRSVFAGKARMQGRLYRLDGYPGLKLSPSAEDWVTGEVYLLSDPEATLRSLDVYEGCGPEDPEPHEYERVEACALLEDGRTLEVWVYVYQRSVAESRRIESGDFLQTT